MLVFKVYKKRFWTTQTPTVSLGAAHVAKHADLSDSIALCCFFITYIILSVSSTCTPFRSGS
jgi:hypothetical protein